MDKNMQKKQNKKNNVVTLLIAFTVVSTIFMANGYSILSEQLFVEATASANREKLNSSAEYEIVDHWYGDFRDNYIVRLIITNNQAVETTGWTIAFDIPSDVNSIDCWEASAEISNGRVKYTSLAHNSVILPGESVEFGIIFSTALTNEYIPTNIVTKLFYKEEEEKPDIEISEDLDVDIDMSGNWGDASTTYYGQYSLTLTNTSDADITSWTVELGDCTKFKVENMWGADYILTDNSLKLSNVGYNGTIKSGQSVTIGFQLSSKIPKYEPYVINTEFSKVTLKPVDPTDDNPTDPENPEVPQEPTNNLAIAKMTKGASWGSGTEYTTQYDVVISNKSEDTIKGYTIEIENKEEYGLKIAAMWNAKYVLTDTKLVITVDTSIQSGSNFQFGYQIVSSDKNFVPKILNEYVKE